MSTPDEPDFEGDELEDDAPVADAVEEPLHDDTGLELASEIAHRLTGRPVAPQTPKRVRPKRREGVQFTAAGRDPRDPQPLGAALGRLAAEQGWQRTLDVHLLLGRWAELVGADLADHSTPEAYADGVLTIRCTSTAWATQLRLLAPSLLASLNERLAGQGSIDRIVAKGPDAPSWKHGRRSVSDGRGPRDTYG